MHLRQPTCRGGIRERMRRAPFYNRSRTSTRTRSNMCTGVRQLTIQLSTLCAAATRQPLAHRRRKHPSLPPAPLTMARTRLRRWLSRQLLTRVSSKLSQNTAVPVEALSILS